MNEGWPWRWLHDAIRDCAHAVRTAGRRPTFILTALLTIAVGTSTLASVLSVVYTVLARPVPYPNADRIVQIGQVVENRPRVEVSTADVLALRESTSLSAVSFAWFSSANLTGHGLPEQVQRVYTDSHAFRILGTRPLLGRWPTAADDAVAADPVAVLSHRLWTQHLGSAADAVGRTIRIDSIEHAVIAVMPAEFRFPAPYWAAGDVWTIRGPAHHAWPTSRSPIVLAFGLLAEGVSKERAQAEVDAIASTLHERFRESSGRIGLQVTWWAEIVRDGAKPRLWLILGAAAVVFLIVCVNVAGLLLSHGLEREREFAARVALGAGTGRLVRQLLAETVLLFIAGGLGGVVAAIQGARLIAAMRSYALPRMDEASVDAVVIGTSLGLTFLAALVVGIVPALQAARARLANLTGAAARGAAGTRRWRQLQRALVSAEVALALVLLSGAGVLLDGARTLARVDPGFDLTGLLHARVTLPVDKYADIQRQRAFYDRLLEQVHGIPGVVAAGVVNVPPGVGGRGYRSVLLGASPAPSSNSDLRVANVRVVSPGYLETLGVRLLQGRHLTAHDSSAAPVAIVNEAFVTSYLADRDPLDHRLRVSFDGTLDELDREPRAIVGVVGNVKERTIYEPAPPTVYFPIAQNSSWRLPLRMALVVRSSRPGGEMTPLLRAAIASVDAEQAAFGFMPLGDLMASELSLNRLNLALLSVLSTIAVFLASVGIYGVTAQGVRQRTREIGIRLALGLSDRGVRGMFLRESVTLVLAGIVAGLTLAIWSAGLLRSVMHGIDRTSPAAFVGAAAVLGLAVLIGSYLPTRRAARIDPAAILRSE